MNLYFDKSLADGYTSSAQRIRRMSEGWVNDNMFCPRCGNSKVEHFTNNEPVADFYCPNCNNQYELKSKSGKLGERINDGAYNSMIERITSNTNPDFLFLNYLPSEYKVVSFVVVPKHFFVPNIIEKREPLSESARRAGWVGCNILLNSIPSQGRIFIINNGVANDKKKIVEQLNRSRLLETNDINARGWLLDVLNCINKINSDVFTLEKVYEFESLLSVKHPENNNVKAKIRQQLQFLRDKGYIEFLARGQYKKL
jgi:type II restriction enzyme